MAFLARKAQQREPAQSAGRPQTSARRVHRGFSL